MSSTSPYTDPTKKFVGFSPGAATVSGTTGVSGGATPAGTMPHVGGQINVPGPGGPSSVGPIQQPITTPSAPAAPAPAAPGGGGGGAGGPDWSKAVEDPTSGLAAQIQSSISSLLQPGAGPYDANTVDAEKQSNLEGAMAQKARMTDEIRRNAVMSGMSRSPITAKQLLAANSQVGQQQMQGSRDIEKNATLQNYQARMASLDSGMKYLDTARNWVLASSKDALSKQELLSKIAMAGAGAAAQQQELQMRIVGMMAGAGDNQFQG